MKEEKQASPAAGCWQSRGAAPAAAMADRGLNRRRAAAAWMLEERVAGGRGRLVALIAAAGSPGPGGRR